MVEAKGPPGAENAGAADKLDSNKRPQIIPFRRRLVNSPRLSAAIAAIRLHPRHGEHRRGCELCRLHGEADEAYAEELLPTLFPGTTWRVAARQSLRAEFGAARHDFGQPLLDHRALFRERGTRGGNSLQGGVLIGHPYQIDAAALDQAARLAAAAVSVWMRDDLSSWAPGWTCLVVASPRLTGLNADAFGFRRLA